MTTLAEFATEHLTVTQILEGPVGHFDASNAINLIGYRPENDFFSTTESSVRRWRKARGWKPEPDIFDVVGEHRAKEEAPVIDVEDVQPLDLEQINTNLRRANNHLSGALAKLKHSKEEYREAVYQAVSDAVSGLEIPPVKFQAPDSRHKNNETAVALLSDVQLAKVTVRGDVEQYNSEIAERRVLEYAKKIVEITNIQRQDHPVKTLTLAVLGDVIEGEEIFPGQMWLIDGGLYRQICVDGPRIMTGMIRYLLQHFERIDVMWVIGNHGRIGGRGSREHDPETNGDRMLGKITQLLLADEITAGRVTWEMPQGKGDRNWYGVVEVGNYRALCLHGDQIRGHSGFPWYGLGKKVSGWASGAVPEDFQDVFMGHWHQIASIPINTRNVYVNGSTESYNTYAQENLAAQSEPAQWLLFVDPERGRVTGEYKVWLDHIV